MGDGFDRSRVLSLTRERFSYVKKIPIKNEKFWSRISISSSSISYMTELFTGWVDNMYWEHTLQPDIYYKSHSHSIFPHIIIREGEEMFCIVSGREYLFIYSTSVTLAVKIAMYHDHFVKSIDDQILIRSYISYYSSAITMAKKENMNDKFPQWDRETFFNKSEATSDPLLNMLREKYEADHRALVAKNSKVILGSILAVAKCLGGRFISVGPWEIVMFETEEMSSCLGRYSPMTDAATILNIGGIDQFRGHSYITLGGFLEQSDAGIYDLREPLDRDFYNETRDIRYTRICDPLNSESYNVDKINQVYNDNIPLIEWFEECGVQPMLI